MTLKKPLIFSAIIFLSFSFIFTKNVLAQTNKTETLVVSPNQLFTEDHFQASESIIFSGQVDGDLFLAGGSVVFDGQVSGDLFVAGGKITINGQVGQNLRAAGGTILVNTNIGRNLLLVGGNLEISQNTKVAGSLITASGNLENNAQVGLGGTIASGRAYINGSFNGNLTAIVDEELLFGPQAKVAGNLKYQAQEQVDFKNPGLVVGTITYSPLSSEAKNLQNIGKKAVPKQISAFMNKAKTPARIIWFLLSFGIGSLFLHFANKFTIKISHLFTDKFLRSTVSGIIYFVTLPVISLFLVLTIIGIPFVLVFGILTGALVIIAKIIGSFAIGHQLLLKFEKKDRRGWALLLGLTITHLISALPFFGTIYSVILAGATSGAMVTYFYHSLRGKHL